MMSKRDAMELENARQFMAELVNVFMSSAELFEMTVDTEVGAVTLCKRENMPKMGFDTELNNDK